MMIILRNYSDILTKVKFFFLKVTTYLAKAATTFSERTTCLEKHELLRKRRLFGFNVDTITSLTPFKCTKDTPNQSPDIYRFVLPSKKK